MQGKAGVERQGAPPSQVDGGMAPGSKGGASPWQGNGRMTLPTTADVPGGASGRSVDEAPAEGTPAGGTGLTAPKLSTNLGYTMFQNAIGSPSSSLLRRRYNDRDSRTRERAVYSCPCSNMLCVQSIQARSNVADCDLCTVTAYAAAKGNCNLVIRR